MINAVSAEELTELQRREKVYRDDLPPPEVEGKTVILVDDGIATGSTMLAAVAALRQLNASSYHSRRARHRRHQPITKSAAQRMMSQLSWFLKTSMRSANGTKIFHKQAMTKSEHFSPRLRAGSLCLLNCVIQRRDTGR